MTLRCWRKTLKKDLFKVAGGVFYFKKPDETIVIKNPKFSATLKEESVKNVPWEEFQESIDELLK